MPAPSVAFGVKEQVLASLLIGLQQPGEQIAPPEAEEAGVEFWNAVKLAQKGEYDKAIEALKKARATHDQRRFTRLRKAQNPLSDPTEDIFLRSCDELIGSWQAREKLRAAGYLRYGPCCGVPLSPPVSAAQAGWPRYSRGIAAGLLGSPGVGH